MSEEIENSQKDKSANINEAIGVYVRKIDHSQAQKNKAKNITYSGFFEDRMLIIRAIRKGMPYKLFNKIKTLTPFSDEDWADYLNLSKKTLQRHRKEANFVFKPIHTEKIIELAEVTNFGKTVFDSNNQFYLWLNTPSYALGNLKPAELLKDSYGKEFVMEELNRIEHGIFV